MRLGEKLRYLRQVEGTLRGLDREMTQQEVVRALKKDLRQSISQSYLSQIESGARPHLTNATRMLLARFFKVHLIDGAERLRRDPEVCQALLTLARHDDSRRCVLLLEAILDTPGLADRLFQVLRPEPAATVRRTGDASVRQAI